MPPDARMKVVAELDLGTAMLKRLQAAIADHAPSLALLNRPEAPAQRPLMLYLLLDLPRHVLPRVGTDPPLDKRVQIHRREGIHIFRHKGTKS